MYLGFVIFSIFGQAICHIARRDPGLIAPIAAALTLIIGVTALFRSIDGAPPRQITAGFAALLVLGAAVELAGASTGLPFGRYVYTQNWTPTVRIPGVGFFPLLVPLAWCLMVAGSTLVVIRLGKGEWPAKFYALAAGLLAAVIDFLMEPVMTGSLGYWHWREPGPLPGGAPFLNLAGWIVTSAVGAAILLALGVRASWRSRDALWVLCGHLALIASITVLNL